MAALRTRPTESATATAASNNLWRPQRARQQPAPSLVLQQPAFCGCRLGRLSPAVCLLAAVMLLLLPPSASFATAGGAEAAGRSRADEQSVERLQRALLSALGLKDVPQLGAGGGRSARYPPPPPPRVPDYMRQLYESRRASGEEAATLHFRRPFAGDANTVRSFLHLGTKVESERVGQGRVTGIDIYFNLSDWSSNETVTSAELRLYRHSAAGSGDRRRQLEVYDVVRRKRRGGGRDGDDLVEVVHLLDTRLIAAAAGEDTDGRSGSGDSGSDPSWVTLDVTPAVLRSLHDGDTMAAASRAVRLRVRLAPASPAGGDGDNPGHDDAAITELSDAGVRVRRSLVASNDEWTNTRPLLLVYSRDERHSSASVQQRYQRQQQQQQSEAAWLSRVRRSVSASSLQSSSPSQRRLRSKAAPPSPQLGSGSGSRGVGRPETCRRHSLWVDFSDVGWKDWIVAPLGYEAYHCQGECPFPLPDQLNTTNHAIVQTLLSTINPEGVPQACCIPTELSPMSMLYLDETQKVVLKNYQEMVVEGCGCR